MFIELTDHLRCPASHEEAYLVLLPGTMEGRSVVTGNLGCPVCGRAFQVVDGVLDVGNAPSPPDGGSTLDAEAITALLGVEGPGGYVVLVGAPAARWRGVLELNPGVAPVAVNPPAEVIDEYPVSVVRGGMIPLKARSVRGVLLGPGYAGDPHWVAEALRIVLPGLRVVGEGSPPTGEAVELLASTAGCWVGVARNRPLS